jgi:hypothetical protein
MEYMVTETKTICCTFIAKVSLINFTLMTLSIDGSQWIIATKESSKLKKFRFQISEKWRSPHNHTEN